MKLAVAIATSLVLGIWFGWKLANKIWYRGLEEFFKYDHPDDWERYLRSFVIAFAARLKNRTKKGQL